VGIVGCRITRYKLLLLFNVRIPSLLISSFHYLKKLLAEGVIYTTRILDQPDLDRQLVRSATCEITIAELELTLPPTSRGQLTTVEGLIRDITTDLNINQPLRRIEDPENYQAIQNVINKLRDILGDDDDKNSQTAKEKDTSMLFPFTIILDDPAGNSFIEFTGNMGDPKWNKKNYHRTPEQNVTLGLVNPEELSTPRVANPESMNVWDVHDDEIFVFPGQCSSCGRSIETNMKKVNIPYFKVSMFVSANYFAFFCCSDNLGYSHHVD